MCEALGMFSVRPLSMPFSVTPPNPRGHNFVDYLLSTVNTHAHTLMVVIIFESQRYYGLLPFGCRALDRYFRGYAIASWTMKTFCRPGPIKAG